MSSLAWYQPVFTFRSVVSHFGSGTVPPPLRESFQATAGNAQQKNMPGQALSKEAVAKSIHSCFPFGDDL